MGEARHTGREAWSSWRLGCGQKSAASTFRLPNPNQRQLTALVILSWEEGSSQLPHCLWVTLVSLDDPNGAYDVP